MFLKPTSHRSVINIFSVFSLEIYYTTHNVPWNGNDEREVLLAVASESKLLVIS